MKMEKTRIRSEIQPNRKTGRCYETGDWGERKRSGLTGSQERHAASPPVEEEEIDVFIIR